MITELRELLGSAVGIETIHDRNRINDETIYVFPVCHASLSWIATSLRDSQ